jgi:molybdopterin synthase sulfur carrier subunit
VLRAEVTVARTGQDERVSTTIRYWAGARAAAGVAAEQTSAATLAEALLLARSVRDDRFGAVLEVCSFVVDGDPVGSRDHATVRLVDGGLVDVLPPFAGG